MVPRRVLRVFLPLLMLVAPACGSNSGPCKDDYDCDGAEVCNRTRGECEPFVCREDADCLDPRLRCAENECVNR